MRHTLTKIAPSSFIALMPLIPVAAAAEVIVGARTGYSLPFGNVQGGDPLDFVSWQIPLHLDVGYEIAGTGLMGGGYTSYGWGLAHGGLCLAHPDSTGNCTASTFRIGLQVQRAFTRSTTTTVPWFGVALGYEGLGQDLSDEYRSSSAVFRLRFRPFFGCRPTCPLPAG